jgi:hypothetical protein
MRKDMMKTIVRIGMCLLMLGMLGVGTTNARVDPNGPPRIPGLYTYYEPGTNIVVGHTIVSCSGAVTYAGTTTASFSFLRYQCPGPIDPIEDF